jgi:hypothetical protein
MKLAIMRCPMTMESYCNSFRIYFRWWFRVIVLLNLMALWFYLERDLMRTFRIPTEMPGKIARTMLNALCVNDAKSGFCLRLHCCNLLVSSTGKVTFTSVRIIRDQPAYKLNSGTRRNFMSTQQIITQSLLR